MKVVIDLIEDIRESISNAEGYIFTAGLLKEDPDDPSRLIYAGEAKLTSFGLDETKRVLEFGIENSKDEITVGEVIPSLLIADIDVMMYEVRVNVNAQYSGMEVVGFGKNDEAQRYVLFIKI